MELPVKALKCGKILTPERAVERGAVLTTGHKIKFVGHEQGAVIPADAEVLDLHELTVLPGFIDIHMHGWGGHDFRALSSETLGEVSRVLPSFGVTTYLLTIGDLTIADMSLALRRAADFISTQDQGARAAGVHLEGPFLNPSKRGAIREEALVGPERSLLDGLLGCGRGQVRMMTISPELEGALNLIPHLRTSGVIPCLGHSEADYALAGEAIKRGARHATHTFNAMGPFHHRSPGLVGAVLTDGSVTAEVIPDGAHTHPAAIKLVCLAKGNAGVVTVTDAHPLAGMDQGSYGNGSGRRVSVTGDGVRLSDGRLAGGTTPMNRLVRNMVEFAGLSVAEAVATATVNPARVMGIEKETGSLEEGKDADITAVDEDFNVRLTMHKGEVIFRT